MIGRVYRVSNAFLIEDHYVGIDVLDVLDDLIEGIFKTFSDGTAR